jgi:hypothetical protein
MITWPINNLFFIILIGYDTNIATSIRNLRSLVFRDINQKKYELPTHASHPHQQEQSSMSLPDIEQQFSCVINEPLTSGSTRLTRDNSRLRRQSTMAALDANEDQVFNTKLPVIHSGISDNSTLNSNTNNKPNRTRHSSC